MKSSTDTGVSSSTIPPPPPYPTLPGPCESNHTHHYHHTITTDEPENDSTMINQDSILRIRRCNTHKCSSTTTTTTTKNEPRKQNESSSTTISRPPPPPPMTVVTPSTKNVHRWTSTPLLLKMGSIGIDITTTTTTAIITPTSSSIRKNNRDDNSSTVPRYNNNNSSNHNHINDHTNHHHHNNSNTAARTWPTLPILLRHPHTKVVHNVCRRIEKMGSRQLQNIFDCRSCDTTTDTSVVPNVDPDSNDIEIITTTHTTSSKTTYSDDPLNVSQPPPPSVLRLPHKRTNRSIPIRMPSTLWKPHSHHQEASSPLTGSSTISKSPMSVETTSTGSSTTGSSTKNDSDHSHRTSSTTRPRPPPSQRRRREVRFNEDLNQVIDSELSPIHIKEYRKSMWWSHKDRVRSMKQRDVDLQYILKQNRPAPTQSTGSTTTSTEHQEGPLPLDPISNADEVKENDLSLDNRNIEDAQTIATQNSKVDTGTTTHAATVLSEYCQAVVTLYLYCHTQCMTTTTMDVNETTRATATASTTSLRLNPDVQHAICIVASSKYRGLERIVCKILQIQKVSIPLTEAERSHWIPNTTTTTTSFAGSIPMQSTPLIPTVPRVPRILRGTENTNGDDTTTPKAIPDEKNRPTTNPLVVATTIVAHETTIEVIHTALSSTLSPRLEIQETVAVPIPVTNSMALSSAMAKEVIRSTGSDMSLLPSILVGSSSSSSSSSSTTTTNSNMSTAMYIRQCVLEYQTQWQHQPPPQRNGSRNPKTKKTGKNYYRGNRDDPTTTPIPLSPPLTTIVLFEESAQEQHHRSRSVDQKDASALRQYYTSFPGHSVSIVWAQLMAIGDASILISGMNHYDGKVIQE